MLALTHTRVRACTHTHTHTHISTHAHHTNLHVLMQLFFLKTKCTVVWIPTIKECLFQRPFSKTLHTGCWSEWVLLLMPGYSSLVLLSDVNSLFNLWTTWKVLRHHPGLVCQTMLRKCCLLLLVCFIYLCCLVELKCIYQPSLEVNGVRVCIHVWIDSYFDLFHFYLFGVWMGSR